MRAAGLGMGCASVALTAGPRALANRRFAIERIPALGQNAPTTIDRETTWDKPRSSKALAAPVGLCRPVSALWPRVASAWRDGIALMPGLRNPPFLLIARRERTTGACTTHPRAAAARAADARGPHAPGRFAARL